MTQNQSPKNKFRAFKSRQSQAVTDLRVTTGIYKGLKLKSPHSSATHPMGSREKLALFNMLGPDLSGLKVLDIYAGTGALGIEALSRGASEAVFVEANHTAINILQENLQRIHNQTTVYPYTAEHFIELAKYIDYFDLIIADPPYDNYRPEVIVKLAPCLKSGGRLVLSHPAAMVAPIIPSTKILTSRHYAAARLTIYQKNSPKT